jgi:CRISPR-associated protein Csb2
MSKLIIQIRFISLSYSGVRIRTDRLEELDWPPSPARLHEALLSAAIVGLPRPAEEQEKLWSAFRWFEELQPPVILASAQQKDAADITANRRIQRPARSNLRIAIPQNNPNKSKLHAHSTLLAPSLKAVPLTDAPLEVMYQWNIEGEAPNGYIEILMDAVARVSYLGRGEDRAEVSLVLVDETPSLPLVRWSPEPAGNTELWTATSGTTDGLKKRHETLVPPRETKPPAQRWMRLVRYSDGAPTPRQPVSSAIFQLFPDNGNPDAVALSCDAASGGLLREFFRHIICDFARETDYWDKPALAAELLTGHRPDNSPTIHPHLAVVPLPSLNVAHTADGRIRRVALLGYAPSEEKKAAQEIYETLFSAFNDFIPTDVPPFAKTSDLSPVRIVRCKVSHDNIWRYLAGKSRVWLTAVPVAISRKFNVPRFATDRKILGENGRRHKRDIELCALLRKSLEHIALPAEIAKATRIEITCTPLMPHTERAERYRPPGEKSFLTHVRLDFPCCVRGPLLLGDRRYFGLGLFLPVEE